jgi:hypothetical protein
MDVLVGGMTVEKGTLATLDLGGRVVIWSALGIDSLADSAFSDSIFALFKRGISSSSLELNKIKVSEAKKKRNASKKKQEDNYDMDSMSCSSAKSLDGLFEG